MDGLDLSRVTARGVGSRCYRATFQGPGGTAMSLFGIVNPLAAMNRAVGGLCEIELPAMPKATDSASLTGGGTSVNSIPSEIWMEFDERSEDPAALAALDTRFQAILGGAVEHENAARSTRVGKIRVEPKVIGERPAGATDPAADIVLNTASAARALGYTQNYDASSTDSNLPMSLKIPAVTIGAGGTGGRADALEEWIDVGKSPSVKGISVGLAALLATAGME